MFFNDGLAIVFFNDDLGIVSNEKTFPQDLVISLVTTITGR